MIEFLEMVQIADDLNFIREQHPTISKELDPCLFEVMSNHTPKCGHAACDYQAMTFERLHIERNLLLRTTNEAKSYEFN